MRSRRRHFHLYLSQTSSLNVFRGDVNHRNDVSGRLQRYQTIINSLNNFAHTDVTWSSGSEENDVQSKWTAGHNHISSSKM